MTSVYEIVIPFIIIISLLFGYSYYENSNQKSSGCAFMKVIGVILILIVVGNLTQSAANVIF
jgi:hypothetical protein